MSRPVIAVALGALLLAACGQDPAGHAHDHGHDHDPAAAGPAEPAGDARRIAIPPVVRRNLGLSFARAEYRPVASTLSVPGRFELRPSAQQRHAAPAGGRVTVLVEPLAAVEAGAVLLRLETPAWSELQRELVAARAARVQAQAELARARAAQAAAGGLSGTGGGEDDVYLAAIRAAEAGVDAAAQRLGQLLAQASALSGIELAALQAETDGVPAWQSLQGIPIRAAQAGVVREIAVASGDWVEAGSELLQVVDPARLRFHGQALQADLIDQLRDGQAVRIVPPEGRGAARRGAAIPGRLRLGLSGDPTLRTVDVFVEVDAAGLEPWVRPQVAALAEVVVAGDPALEELAIPLRAVIQDGLETVFFRRDPDDPDSVIRSVADLGPSDGRWVTVYSGLGEGDQVVVDGVYQLKLATTGREVGAGHFHADGTWHEGDH